MKKNILLFSFATLLCSTQYTFAGDANPLQVKCFEAEGATIYDVRGCVPGSDISFYSQQGGGEMMKEIRVDANGIVRLTWNQKSMPAFVLNVLNANASGIAGNGMVSFTADKEFAINDLTLNNNSGSVTLRWNGSVNNPGSYTFQVLKSVNGADYTLIQSVNVQSNAMLPYSFIDPSQPDGTATYQVRIVNTGNETYYTSGPLYADGSSGISVYPTIAHTTLNIRLNDTRNSTYRILNMNGQLITSGVLNNAQNSCSVAMLPAGNYLVEISTPGNKTITKFVKE